MINRRDAIDMTDNPADHLKYGTPCRFTKPDGNGWAYCRMCGYAVVTRFHYYPDPSADPTPPKGGSDDE